MHSIKDQERPTDSQSLKQRAKQKKGEAKAGQGRKRKTKERKAKERKKGKEGIGKKMQEQETARLDMRREVCAKVCSELSNRVRDTENEAEKKKQSLSWKETGEIA